MSCVIYEYDDEMHVYTADGIKIPSVTEILHASGMVDPHGWFSGASAQRGSVVHECCRLDDEGDLDEASVSDSVRCYLDGWRKFRREFPCRFVSIEKPYFCSSYAGTPDRVTIDNWIIDIKTGSAAPWHAIQLAAYAHLVWLKHGDVKSGKYSVNESGYGKRLIVTLNGRGKYNIHTCSSRSRDRDWMRFMSALNNFNNQKGENTCKV